MWDWFVDHLAVIMFFVLGFFPVLILSWILNAFGLLRVPVRAEIAGLDFEGEAAYEAAIAEVKAAELAVLASTNGR